MDTVQIALCDTCRASVSYYSRLIRKIASQNKINIKIAEFRSAEQLLYEISSSPGKYGILFLNVTLGKMNGIELAKHLKTTNSNPQIIFTTSETELTTAFTDALFKCKRNRTYTLYTTSAILEIPIETIKYFEVRGPIVLVYCNHHMYDTCDTITRIEKMLPDFIRTCNNFIVNPVWIEQIEQYKVMLSTGENIPLHRRRYQAVKKMCEKFDESMN